MKLEHKTLKKGEKIENFIKPGQEFEVFAVPGPPVIIKGDENIKRFLALKPNKEVNEASRKRAEKFKEICKEVEPSGKDKNWKESEEFKRLKKEFKIERAKEQIAAGADRAAILVLNGLVEEDLETENGGK